MSSGSNAFVSCSEVYGLRCYGLAQHEYLVLSIPMQEDKVPHLQDACAPWNDFVSNQRLLHETESRPVTSIVRESQLRLYGHVARLPDVDPAHRVLSVRDNPRWRRPRGRPRKSWLGKVDRSCRELLRMGRMVAWGIARRDHPGWRHRVSDATRPPAYAPH